MLLKPVIPSPIIAAWSEPSKMMKNKHITMRVNPNKVLGLERSPGFGRMASGDGRDNYDLLDDSG
jgi:hypothetical protein